jgi:hypothetical protein
MGFSISFFFPSVFFSHLSKVGFHMSYDGALGVLIFLFLPFLDGRDVIAALSYYWKFSVVDSELDASVFDSDVCALVNRGGLASNRAPVQQNPGIVMIQSTVAHAAAHAAFTPQVPRR